MRCERVRVSLLVLAGLLAVPAQAWSGAAPKDEVADRLAIINDLTKPDDERARARDALATDRKLIAQGSIKKLIDLGKSAANDNVRMHVAIALSQVRLRGPRVDIAANLDLLVGWQQRKDADPALRYWAALAIANSRTGAALKALKPTLEAADDLTTVNAVVRALGDWKGREGRLRELALPVLLGLLSHRDPPVRVAGIQGVQLTRVNEARVIEPLAKIAADDPDEPAWRAAERALNELAKGMKIRRMLIRVGAPDAERKEVVRIWLFEWRRAKKRSAKPK